MAESNLPFTADDLRRIAKSLDQWERLLINRDGAFTPRAELISRIEVTRPDDVDNVIGHFVLHDGWVGFVPLAGDHRA